MNRGSLRAQLRETVRGEILDAAEALIAEHGVNRAALAAIARRAGVAVGTLYNYFTDREALIAALFETRRATLRPMIANAVRTARKLAFEPRLRALVQGVLAAFDAHRRFIKVAIETEHIRLAPAAIATDLHEAIDDALRAGVAEGVLGKADAEVASFMLAGAIKSVVLRRTAEGKPFAADADRVVGLFLDGVRSAP